MFVPQVKFREAGLSPEQVALAHRKIMRRALYLTAQDLGRWWLMHWPVVAPIFLDRPTPITSASAWVSGMKARLQKGLARTGKVAPFVFAEGPNGRISFGIEMGFSTKRGKSLRSGKNLRSAAGWLSNVEARQKPLERIRIWIDPVFAHRFLDQYGNIPNRVDYPLYAEMSDVLQSAEDSLSGGGKLEPKPPRGFRSVGEWAEKRFGISRRYFRLRGSAGSSVALAYYTPGGRLHAFAGFGKNLKVAPKKFNLETLIRGKAAAYRSERIRTHYRRIWNEVFAGAGVRLRGGGAGTVKSFMGRINAL